MGKCPTCERELVSFKDYPLIYVAKFEKKDIPPDVKFPDEDEKIDQKEIIMRHLNPYLHTLENLVGKEVPSSKLIPPFGNPLHKDYKIPEITGRYELALFQMAGETETHRKEIELKIVRTSGGSFVSYNFLATVGILEYEGRIRK